MSLIPDRMKFLRFERWLINGAILVLVIVVVFLLTAPSLDSSFSSDPRFVVTTRPQMGLPASASLKDRIFIWRLQLYQRFRKPNPLAWSFGASPTNQCSVHGLLNQCAEITGVRYVIAREVASGSVLFGCTNTLNGVQWVAAFTEALQTGKPGWWDTKNQIFHNENLVFVTNSPKTILVLPAAMAADFQRKKSN
ncbi:MAG: hypothetical protein HY043_21345 [Verrucomicrobia bacterium]|nr:hypothetical protein [Verrucomicrobiota bacterium]